MKQYAPATSRNRDAIAAILANELHELADDSLLLEVASGTGEHGNFFASAFPRLNWQPSDPDATALDSIAIRQEEYDGGNLLSPLRLDASSAHWPIKHAETIFCCNMIHISPISATLGLFQGAKRILGKGSPLILYGPYIEEDIETAQSNLDFHASLKGRNSEWGLRERHWVDGQAEIQGFVRTARHEMPANNLMLVYRKLAD